MYCLSSNVKCNGKSFQGKQRYLCLSCNKSYLWKSSKPIEQRRFCWFKQRVTEGYSIRELAIMKGTSQSTLKRVISYWLKQTPNDIDNDYSNIKHVIFDGTFLRRPRGIYAALDSETHKLLHAAVNVRETSSDLIMFYSHLLEAGLNPESATTDGNTAQTKQLKNLWPDIKLQRCVVHVQRQGLS